MLHVYLSTTVDPTDKNLIDNIVYRFQLDMPFDSNDLCPTIMKEIKNTPYKNVLGFIYSDVIKDLDGYPNAHVMLIDGDSYQEDSTYDEEEEDDEETYEPDGDYVIVVEKESKDDPYDFEVKKK